MGLFWSKKKADKESRAATIAFHKAIEQIKEREPQYHIVVGHGVNMMNSFFIKKFNDINSFLTTSARDKQKYIKSIEDFESKMAEKDYGVATGALLFRIWLVEMNNYGHDSEHVVEMSKELAWLSKKGEILGKI